MKCNMNDEGNLDYLPARGGKGDLNVKSFQSLMDCKMHTFIYLFRSAQGHETDAQADDQGLVDRNAYCDILKEVKGLKVAPKWCWTDIRGRTD